MNQGSEKPSLQDPIVGNLLQFAQDGMVWRSHLPLPFRDGLSRAGLRHAGRASRWGQLVLPATARALLVLHTNGPTVPTAVSPAHFMSNCKAPLEPLVQNGDRKSLGMAQPAAVSLQMS